MLPSNDTIVFFRRVGLLVGLSILSNVLDFMSVENFGFIVMERYLSCFYLIKKLLNLWSKLGPVFFFYVVRLFLRRFLLNLKKEYLQFFS